LHNEEKFDLIVIRSSSGLDVGNAAATQNGLKVAIIEKDKMGGTCLNRGCIPSMGRAIEDRDGFVKFLVSTEEENRKILGCHIIAAHASILLHEVLVAIRAGNGTIDNIRKTIHIHPALSEVIVRAAEAIRD
jgi:pyruvate/2-oxoglutarate dehydrogenase complex dihydrolipoamide dehydrogenase (E3) component